MSDDWIEESALKFEGFTDAEIAQIKAAIPKVQALIAKVQANQAFFNGLVSEVEALLPTLNMVTTKLKGRLE
jgi:hypothetical protein